MSENNEAAVDYIKGGIESCQGIIDHMKNSVGGVEGLVRLNPVVALAFSTIEACLKDDFGYAVELLEAPEAA